MKRAAVFSFLFLAWINAWAAPALLDRLEASVNTAIILRSDTQHFRRTLALRAQLDPLFSGTSLASKGEQVSDSEIVDFLIQEKLIAQQFAVPEADVEQEINSIQANNKIDRAGLKRALKDQGYAFEDYFELIRSSTAKRNLIDREIRTKVSISEEDVKNYFFNHLAGTSSLLLSYQLKIITVTVKNYKNAAAAREVAERALKDLRGGEAFEEVAKRFSDDPSASSGGDLGALTENEMSPAIRTQVKKMQIGQTSELLGSAQTGSFFIFKLVDIKSLENDRFDKMKEEIRNQLATAEYRHQVLLWLERTRQKAFVHKAGDSPLSGLGHAP